MSEHKDIIAEIKDFIEKHANISPGYDPEYDEPEERFTGPDTMMLNLAAISLEKDENYPFVHSDWGSGCYHPYADTEARAWHDDLVKRVNDLRLSFQPSLR